MRRTAKPAVAAGILYSMTFGTSAPGMAQDYFYYYGIAHWGGGYGYYDFGPYRHYGSPGK